MKTATRKRNKPVLVVRQQGGGGKIRGARLEPGAFRKFSVAGVLTVSIQNDSPRPMFVHTPIEVH